jgi:DnaK suppressor protein
MTDQSIIQALESRRRELQDELDRLTEPPEEGASVGFGKRVGDGTTEAVERLATTATARSIHRSLQDVERALARAEDGNYGICEVCGSAIPETRMEALPATTRCIGCASNRVGWSGDGDYQ